MSSQRSMQKKKMLKRFWDWPLPPQSWWTDGRTNRRWTTQHWKSTAAFRLAELKMNGVLCLLCVHLETKLGLASSSTMRWNYWWNMSGVRTSDPVLRNPSCYLWNTEPAYEFATYELSILLEIHPPPWKFNGRFFLPNSERPFYEVGCNPWAEIGKFSDHNAFVFILF